MIRGIGRRNASASTGNMMKSATTEITEYLGRIGSARSSSTAGARVWIVSQLLKTAWSAPPSHVAIGVHQYSRGSGARLHLHHIRRRPRSTRRRSAARSERSDTSHVGARTASPNHKNGESNDSAA